jgi:hypothetical protein
VSVYPRNAETEDIVSREIRVTGDYTRTDVSWYMYVCMYVCMYICICSDVSWCLYIHETRKLKILLAERLGSQVIICVLNHLGICMYVCMYVYMYM